MHAPLPTLSSGICVTYFEQSMLPEPVTNLEQNNEHMDYHIWAYLTCILGNKNLN